MSRAIAEIHRERSISTLVEHLFVFEGPDAAKDKRRAERALLRDNPQLADRANFTSGMTIIVPLDLGLRTTDRVRRPGGDLTGVLDEGSARIAQADAAIVGAFERRSKEAAEALDRLGDRRFVAAVRAVGPEAAERLGTMRSALKAEVAATAQRREAWARATKAAAEELARLRELAGTEGDVR